MTVESQMEKKKHGKTIRNWHQIVVYRLLFGGSLDLILSTQQW